MPTLAFRLFNFVWGGVCAFIGAIGAGSEPLSADNVLWWPLAAFLLYYVGRYARTATFDRAAGQSWLAAFGSGWAMLAGAIYVALIAAGFAPAAALNIPDTPSPGLVMLAFFVGAMGLHMTLAAYLPQPDLPLRDWLASPITQAGIDILAVMGGAAFIVWLGQALAGV